jgi:hypothetical protein
MCEISLSICLGVTLQSNYRNNNLETDKTDYECYLTKR